MASTKETNKHITLFEGNKVWEGYSELYEKIVQLMKKPRNATKKFVILRFFAIIYICQQN